MDERNCGKGINMNQEALKREILNKVAEYAGSFLGQEDEYLPVKRIPYASRVYDKEEICNLVDSALEFWLTS